MLLSVAIGVQVPFSSIMILWANVVVDVPPSLSIGMEPPERSIMTRSPRDPTKGVFSRTTAAILLTQGISMSLIALAAYIIAQNYESYELHHARTLSFTLLCFVQLSHAFFIKSMRESIFVTGITGNKWLIYAFLLSGACLVAGIYIPGFNDLLELVPLGWFDWVKIVIAIFVHLLFVESQKLVLRIISRLRQRAHKSVELEQV